MMNVLYRIQMYLGVLDRAKSGTTVVIILHSIGIIIFERTWSYLNGRLLRNWSGHKKLTHRIQAEQIVPERMDSQHLVSKFEIPVKFHDQLRMAHHGARNGSHLGVNAANHDFEKWYCICTGAILAWYIVALLLFCSKSNYKINISNMVLLFYVKTA